MLVKELLKKLEGVCPETLVVIEGEEFMMAIDETKSGIDYLTGHATSDPEGLHVVIDESGKPKEYPDVQIFVLIPDSYKHSQEVE